MNSDNFDPETGRGNHYVLFSACKIEHKIQERAVEFTMRFFFGNPYRNLLTDTVNSTLSASFLY